MAEHKYYFTDAERNFIINLPVPMAVNQYYDGFYHIIAVSAALQELMHWADKQWESLVSMELPKEFKTRAGGREIRLEGEVFSAEKADSLLWYVVFAAKSKERKKHWFPKSKLSLNENMMDKILDTTQDCVFWKDLNRRFVGVNKAFLTAYGLDSAEELIGKTDEDMDWHSDPEPFRRDELEVLKGKSTRLVQGKCVIRGRERDILASKTPLYEDGKIIGLVGSFIDITDQVEKEHEIRDLIEEREVALLEAEQARETMSQFIMRASHEMRTPLNAILGFTQLADGNTNPDVLQDYIKKIQIS
ncbi:MAG: PAS domain-containing protein, partial [Lachnospiraceae bacterium]|nr:PAS domain-containing protein [Lachnospiraceae bacterium]